ncbi:helix-turn-helix protein [Nitrospirillum amazonense]|uniref:Helix-turn-helix protein n=1 Tax=Nitrospirillum amazonense TaxID=28077 RepID=A0A560FLH4_9PROT|nr:helix-turn-helix transcriptional regulator [Nitrospirillum amazonense]TWB22450.1 helix-turn-helix protein [Nitrospirillum amazonense]
MWVQPKDHQIVGNYLATIRRQAGVTQDELAAQLGKPQSFVSAYESGQRRVDILELMIILKALGADPKTTLAALIDHGGVHLKASKLAVFNKSDQTDDDG